MNKRIIAAILLSVSLLYGCIEKIDSPVDAPRKIVVNCLLTQDSIQTLNLTYSNELGDLVYDKVEEADVRLYANGNEVGQFRRNGVSFNWSLKYTPIPETEYRLEVKVDGWPLVWATTIFPQPISISRDAKSDKGTKRGFMTWKRTGVFWVVGFAMKEDIYMAYPGEKSITIDNDDYKLGRIGTSFRNVDDFNLSQGKDKTDDDKYLTYLRMLPYDRTYFNIYDIYMGKVVFRTPSEEYDKYLKTSITKMMRYMNEDDPTTWLDETEIYNNINNGVGIFGAYYEVIMYCNSDNTTELPQNFNWE